MKVNERAMKIVNFLKEMGHFPSGPVDYDILAEDINEFLLPLIKDGFSKEEIKAGLEYWMDHKNENYEFERDHWDMFLVSQMLSNLDDTYEELMEEVE